MGPKISYELGGLAKRLESTGMLPNYDPNSGFSRLQQFQSEVVRNMASEEMPKTHQSVVRKSTIPINDDTYLTIYWRNNGVSNISAHISNRDSVGMPFTVEIDNSTGYSIFVDNARYLRNAYCVIGSAYEHITDILCGLDEDSSVNTNEIFQGIFDLFSATPPVFKGVHSMAILEARNAARIILDRLGDEFDSSREVVADQSPFDIAQKRLKADIDQAYDLALNHLNTLS